MKYAVLLATGATLALGACQQSGEPATSDAAAAEATDAAAPAPAPTPAGFAAGQPPSKEFMVGTWGEGDACALPITFEADGTIKDGPFDSWTLENGELVMGGQVKLKVVVIDDRTMESLVDGDTEKRTLKRCG